VESVWSVSKLSTGFVGSRRELVANSVRTADADATLVASSSAVCIGLYRRRFICTHLVIAGQSVAVEDLLSEAWSRYWSVISRRSVQTAVMYVIMTLLLTACPAVCVYYSVRCTRLINSLQQSTHALDNETKVTSALCSFLIQYTILSF